jgi:hypothetical protein
MASEPGVQQSSAVDTTVLEDVLSGRLAVHAVVAWLNGHTEARAAVDKRYRISGRF